MRSLFPEAAPVVTVEQLAGLLRRYRFPVSDELAFQNALARVLSEHGIAHERERQLGPWGTVDFYLPAERLGIELKVKGSPSAVTRQLHRYVQSPEIEALMLVTWRAALGRLPARLHDKPLTVVALWEAGV